MNKYGRGPVLGEEKNGYVPLGTYPNINLDIFWGGPLQYFNKIPYSNILGTTSKKTPSRWILIFISQPQAFCMFLICSL